MTTRHDSQQGSPHRSRQRNDDAPSAMRSIGKNNHLLRSALEAIRGYPINLRERQQQRQNVPRPDPLYESLQRTRSSCEAGMTSGVRGASGGNITRRAAHLSGGNVQGGKIRLQEMEDALMSKDENGRFQCTLCKSNYARKGDCRVHIQMHHVIGNSYRKRRKVRICEVSLYTLPKNIQILGCYCIVLTLFILTFMNGHMGNRRRILFAISAERERQVGRH